MTVQQLIDKLEQLPKGAEVKALDIYREHDTVEDVKLITEGYVLISTFMI